MPTRSPRFTPVWICVSFTNRRCRLTYLALARVVVFAACLLPAASLTWRALHDMLGANPVEALVRGSGDWTLRLLLITLALAPLRRLTGWPLWLRLRRMLGLYTFFYACIHMTIYLAVDRAFAWDEIVEDVLKRPYITLGVMAFVVLIPLAVTSTDAMMRRLGRRWKHLHRLVYPIAVLAVVHYALLVKADLREPLLYGAILSLLLLFQLEKKGTPRPQPRME